MLTGFPVCRIVFLWLTLVFIFSCQRVVNAVISDCVCCKRNATAAECVKGAVDLRSRPDCPCCSVCAKSLGAACNAASKECSDGLDCVKGVCSEPALCRSDSECPADRFCLGQVCFDPCTILDPCKSSLKNGVCTTRQHRPVCSCAPGFRFEATSKACVPEECLVNDGTSVDVGKKFFRHHCLETCVCGSGGDTNCTRTTCPPGSYLPGSFADDKTCVELRDPNDRDSCCVNVFCSNIQPEPELIASTLPSTDVPSDTFRQQSSTVSSATVSTSSASPGYDPLLFQMIEVGHNWTLLRMPSIDGLLNYQSMFSSEPIDVQMSGSEDGGAAGNLRRNVTGLSPDTLYTFTWSSDAATAGNDKISLKVYTLPGCFDGNVSYGIGESYTRGCEAICYCGANARPSCRPRCVLARGASRAPGSDFHGGSSCRETPDPDDPQCCVKLECTIEDTDGSLAGNTALPPSSFDSTESQSTSTVIFERSLTDDPYQSSPDDNYSRNTVTDDPYQSSPDDNYSRNTVTETTTFPDTLEGRTVPRDRFPSSPPPSVPAEPQPTLLVTAKTASSVTLAWDDFKPQHHAGDTPSYVAEYRRFGGHTEPHQWRRKQLPPGGSDGALPLMLIDGLQPSEEYEVRVSIYQDGARELRGASTETIRFFTDDGCLHDNVTYSVGEQFHRGCSQTCTCDRGGEVKCGARCPPPLQPEGAVSERRGCYEKSVDQCCVMVACTDADTHVQDPSVVGGGCSNFDCGENYVCEVMTKRSAHSHGQSVAMCVCPTGFVESEITIDHRVCRKVEPELQAGCRYNENIYKPGDRFNKGCDYSCLCNEAEEIECNPRCPGGPLLSLETGCHLETDPEDSCCQIAVCDHEHNNTVNSRFLPVPVVEQSEGTCLWNGVAHQAGATVERGCATRCVCQTDGQFDCHPRCNMTTVSQTSADRSCSLQTDPTDPCCMITVCTSTSASTLTSPLPPPERDLGVSGRVSRLDSVHAESLQVIGVDQLNSSSTRIRLRVSRDVLNALLAGGQDSPLLVAQWRRVRDDSGAPTEWSTRQFTAEQVSVLDVHTLLVTVNDLLVDDQVWIRAQFGQLISPQVLSKDLMTSHPVSSSPFRPDHDVTTLPAEVNVCSDGYFTCLDGQCIPNWQTCDFIYDCTEEEDESFCDGTNTETTPERDGLLQKSTRLATSTERLPNSTLGKEQGSQCEYRGRSMTLAEEVLDGCDRFCICTRQGTQCAPLECPTDFGQELVNPNCLKWEVDPAFVASPPECCPKMVCADDGSCEFAGHRLANFDEVPVDLSGCDRRCYCDYGNITCRSVCSPVSASPPGSLSCRPGRAQLRSDGCCKQWQCDETEETVGFPVAGVSSFEDLFNSTGEISDVSVEVTGESSAKFTFSVPAYLVGVPGQTEIFFTDKPDSNVQLWARRVYIDQAGVVSGAVLSYFLTGLTGNTAYVARLRQLAQLTKQVFTSQTLNFRTLAPSADEKQLPAKWYVDAELQASSISQRSAQIRWRKLNETVLKYVDGIQLRYRDLDANAQVWTMTPFIHRELSHYRLDELKPDTSYQVDIVLMPFQNQSTEVVSSRPLQIHTLAVVDLYDFNISLRLENLSAHSVLVVWRGFPRPQYNFVNVYRVVYIDEKERTEQHTFKLAKSADRPSLLLKNLKANNKYQVWLEAYLKNGKRRVSEVQEFVTKPGLSGRGKAARQNNGVLSGSLSAGGGIPGEDGSTGNYFGTMLAVSGVAAVLALACLLLLLLLLRQSAGTKKKAPITRARKNGPSYENPAFKSSELDLNGSGGNERFA